MKIISFRPSFSILIILLSLFLVGAGFSRYLETDSGNILIHDIEIESYEAFPYNGRLFRPLQASSLNLRPAILLIPGNVGDRYTCDHIAMELARRGFVALTMEDFSQGLTSPKPDYYTENVVDAGYTFLATRSFTDHDRIGLAAYYEGTEKADAAAHFDDFASRVFICPTRTFDFAHKDQVTEIVMSFKPFALINRSVISELLEKFHQDLAIPNDSPFWFDSASQRAQLLVYLRFILLVLLVFLISGLSSRILSGNGHAAWRVFFGLLLPLLVFQFISEIMNFFLISVRLGSPFHYLPRMAQIQRCFSVSNCLLVMIITLIWSFSFNLKNTSVFISDCSFLINLFLCLFLSAKEGIQYSLLLTSALAFVNSLLMRFTGSQRRFRYITTAVNGVMFYLICCSLPLFGNF